MLVAAPVVSAQSAGGDQYNPGGGVGPAGGADNGPGDDGTGPTGGEFQANPAGTGESGGGELPFTGYPLTPLVLAVILLVALGLAFRLTSDWRQRVSAAHTTSG